MSSVTAESTPAFPLVSVIIPTYNRADLIGEAIDSVLAQSYSNFEILVVDDGSTDDTKDVVRRYDAEPRFHYFTQANQGQSVARNLALSKAKGSYICFLDSDNRWLPHKLEKSLAVFAANPDADIVYGDIIHIDEKGAELHRKNMERRSGSIAKYLFRDNFVSMNTTMVRKKCFDEMGGLEVGRRAADDYELWLRFSARYKFLYIKDFFAEYRIMADQISSNKDRRFKSNEEIMRNFLAKFPDAMSAQEIKEGWCHFYTRRGRYYASVGQLRKAFADYCRALSFAPLNKAPIRAMGRLFVLRS